jgi:uncharacterized protein
LGKVIGRGLVVLFILVAIFAFLVNQASPENSIQVDRNLTSEQLKEMGVFNWHTWEKEPSVFVWQFHEIETAYVLEGEVFVTPEGSTKSVLIKKGDLVTFSAGLRCTWNVLKPFRKHVTHADTPFVSAFWHTVFKAQGAMRHIKAITE